MSRLPLIGVTDCSRQVGRHVCHISGDISARAMGSAAWMILSSLTVRLSPSDILDGRNGTPITVTPFNIEPIHNSGSAIVQGTARDSARLISVHVPTSTPAWRRLAFQRDADASTIA
ncbi:glutamine amidotransferase [Pseudomonas sp. C32]|uniref:glutamine amidotransferase n=1 Tax=Pseudomonas sp. C32 TaxID=1529208 RepID=UPI002604428A|nr:glutamine amidotransferase [Pseudomonas sp. C32]MDN4544374.1 glutamine amidotransferase [Pseudomonas sp. C32]